MRVEFINDEEFSIFINSCYCKINDYNDKDKIIDVVKNVISKYKNKFRLRGFYKIKVFPLDKVGLFVEGIKLESLEKSGIIDLRVIVYFDEEFYFKTDNYYVINNISDIKYFNGNYYCLVKDISDINAVVDYGDFLYGENLLEIMDKACVI